MAAVSRSSGILPPMLWPTVSPEVHGRCADEAGKNAAAYANYVQMRQSTAAKLEGLTEGYFSEAMVMAHRLNGLDGEDGKAAYLAAKKIHHAMQSEAQSLSDALDMIEGDAQMRMSGATSQAERQEIMQEARILAAAAVAAAASVIQLKGRQGIAEITSCLARISSRRMPVELVSPKPGPAPGSTHALGNGAVRPASTHGNLRRDGNNARTPQDDSDLSTASRGSGKESAEDSPTKGSDTKTSDTRGTASSDSDLPSGAVVAKPSMPTSMRGDAASGGPANSGRMSVPSASGGGIPSGLGGVPAGGGSGGGLSGLGSGLSGTGLSGSGLSGAGLSGPGLSGPAGSGVPSLGGGGVDPSAFSRGVAAGSGAVASAGPLGPAPGLPGPAASSASTSTGGAAAASPAAAAGGVAPAAGVSGAPPAAAAGGVVGSPAGGSPGGGMLLPSPGMGAPAAAVAGGAGSAAGASVTVPQGGSSSSAGSGSGGGGGGGVGSAVPVAPAPHVVARNIRAAQAGDGAESPDMTAAVKLASRLVADCTAADYPTIDWCVGVFRSADGAADMVVASNAGFGYVPAGVYVPRTARVIGSDPLVDEAFRNRWFGWADPARILVEYGRLRPEGWRLVAAATTTDDVDALRDNGIEHRIAQRPDNPNLLSRPVLDADHMHRLELEHRDLHERLTPLLDSDVERWMRERVAVPLGQAAVHSLVSSGVDCPDELRVVWRALMDEQRTPTRAEWGAFSDRCRSAYLEPDFSRPVGDPLPNASSRPQAVYEKPWRLARTMELVLSWYADPPVLPLADMAYAAAAAGVDVRAVLSEPLRLVESHLR